MLRAIVHVDINDPFAYRLADFGSQQYWSQSLEHGSKDARNFQGDHARAHSSAKWIGDIISAHRKGQDKGYDEPND